MMIIFKKKIAVEHQELTACHRKDGGKNQGKKPEWKCSSENLNQFLLVDPKEIPTEAGRNSRA